MAFFIILFGILIAVALTVTINAAGKSAVNKPKESSAESSFHFGTEFRLIDGIHGWGKGVLVIKAELHDSEIVFYASPTGDSKKISLKYNQITGTQFYSEKEIIEKSKSVVGRAAAGAVLFGPLGGIIGGLSGTGTKSDEKVHYYYTINYISSTGEECMITLSDDCGFCDRYQFDKYLKQFIPNTQPDYL